MTGLAPYLAWWAAAAPDSGSGGLDATPIVVALIAATAASVPGILAWRASSRANATSDRKVDAEAFDRAAALYDKALAAAERETERLRSQVERINAQLAQEMDVSNVLRNQVRTLESQVRTLESLVAELRSVRAGAAGGEAAGPA